MDYLGLFWGGPAPVVFTGAPCKHQSSVRRRLRAIPKGQNCIVFEGEIDAPIYANQREEQIKRALRLHVVPPSRAAVP